MKAVWLLPSWHSVSRGLICFVVGKEEASYKLVLIKKGFLRTIVIFRMIVFVVKMFLQQLGKEYAFFDFFCD